ncbi:MAG: hypothetical protein ACRDY7_06845 [Acidimicrobiia bacterium]
MNRIRIGLVGSVVLALVGLNVGGAAAVDGRGTSNASITLLDVKLGGVQNLKVLTNRGQGTLDAARFNLGSPQAFGELIAVDAAGAVNLSLPNPPIRAQAPGNSTGTLAPIPVAFPPAGTPALAGQTLGAGLLAEGTVNPAKVEAAQDSKGARSTVATGIPSLDVLQGLISVKDVEISGVSSNAAPSASTADSGVLSIGEINVLDLTSFLGGLGLGLDDLGIDTLTGLVGSLGLPVPAIPGVAAASSLTDVNGLLSTVTDLSGLLGTVNGATNCDSIASAGGIFGDLGLGNLLGTGDLLGSGGLLGLDLSNLLGLGDILGACEAAGVQATKTQAIDTLTSAINPLLAPAESVLDDLFGILDGAPLLSLSGVELSALAKAVQDPAASEAVATTKFGTIKVGGKDLGVLDLNAVVDQVNSLVTTVESTLGSVTSVLGLGEQLIDIGIMEKTSDVKSEGGYTVADAGVNALRVSINPPELLSDVLAPVTSNSVSGLLGGGLPVLPAVGGLLEGLPVSGGLADGTLASAFSLTSLLSQPTSITVGAIKAHSDFTTDPNAVAAPGTADAGPIAPPVSGNLPRTGMNGGAMAALAAVAIGGAFVMARALRRNPIEG